MQDRGHGTGRGPWLRALPLLAERLPCRLDRQPCGGDARAKRRVLVRMRIGELTKRCSRLLGLVFPAFPSTEGRLRPKANEPGSSLRHAKRHGLASPTKQGFGQEGIAPTILHRHLGLKGSPCRPAHLGGRQTEISELRGTERRSACKRRVWYAHDRTSRTGSSSLFCRII